MTVVTALNDPMIFITPSVTMVPGKRYVANQVGVRTQFTLPTTALVGQWIEIIGYQNGGWRLLTNAGQHVVMGDYAFGDLDYYDSMYANETIRLQCISASPSLFIATSGRGETFMPYNKEMGGRLTADGSNPVPTTDITMAGIISYVPYKHNIVSLYYEGSFGINTWVQYKIPSGLEFDLSTLMDIGVYDIFLHCDPGSHQLELTAEKWLDNFTRVFPLVRQDGVLVHQSDHTKRYLGTVHVHDFLIYDFSREIRGLWNYYNRVPFTLIKQNGNTSWTYNTDTYHEAGPFGGLSTAKFVVGVVEDAVSASVIGAARNTTGTSLVQVGIGLNSSTTASCISTPAIVDSTSPLNVLVPLTAQTTLMPLSAGANELLWLERSDTDSGSTTFYGQDGQIQCGLAGVVYC